ncbi:hypothetical protein HHI36_000707 [Cryptolaemus montrouzieri]|uniref:Uncharacterized protein n=1 Tax=Cryptolaemus montrouzieri TaxID=559131 RepID=A0ABD2P630_9CUCU
MPPHPQNETTVSEHTEDEMKINYTETNIPNQSNVIGETNNEDVQTVNVPSSFETVLFWPEERPESASKRKEEKIPSVITTLGWIVFGSIPFVNNENKLTFNITSSNESPGESPTTPNNEFDELHNSLSAFWKNPLSLVSELRAREEKLVKCYEDYQTEQTKIAMSEMFTDNRDDEDGEEIENTYFNLLSPCGTLEYYPHLHFIQQT